MKYVIADTWVTREERQQSRATLLGLVVTNECPLQICLAGLISTSRV